MAELIISVSGLRGIVGDTLTTDIAHRYAAAFAGGLPAGTVIVTRDGRANGGELVAPIMAGLAAGGATKVINAGVAATPTTGVLIRQHQAEGGVQISASHNPAEYNGMKLFSAEGRVIPGGEGAKVLERYQNSGAPSPADEKAGLGEFQELADTTARHLEMVLATVDADRIRSKQFSVLLDSNHGAGSVLGEKLLTALGCKVTVLGGTPNGLFVHTPEPTAENLATVLQEVVASESVIGFCQDPDADRLAIIDEHGRYLGEEYTLALCVDHVLRQTPGPIVTNCSTSRMTEDLANKYGVPFQRSAVGEANVVDKLKEIGAVFAGEGNGGPIDPRIGFVRDSFVGMALVLDAMAARDMPVSALAEELPQYAICKTKIELAKDKVTPGLEALAKHFDGANADYLDGLRLDWADRWLLVRASNTEPIVRAIAEAPTMEAAEELCMVAASVLEKL